MVKNDNKKLAVLGFPIKHSLSPLIHEYWFSKYKISAEYKIIEVKPPELRGVLLSLYDRGYLGVNITIPHKEAALGIVSEADMTAKKIGAVNTVKIDDDKTVIGTNTDAYGFIENIKSQTENWQRYLEKIVVLGAGGAARAAVVALIDAGAKEILLLNRNRKRAKQLQEYFQTISTTVINTDMWEKREELLARATMLVNSTALGMSGMPDLQLSLQYLPKNALVVDVIYRPLETTLLLTARQNGNPTTDGLGMLIYQAQKSFDLWFGIKPQVTDELRKLLLREM